MGQTRIAENGLDVWLIGQVDRVTNVFTICIILGRTEEGGERGRLLLTLSHAFQPGCLYFSRLLGFNCFHYGPSCRFPWFLELFEPLIDVTFPRQIYEGLHRHRVAKFLFNVLLRRLTRGYRGLSWRITLVIVRIDRIFSYFFLTKNNLFPITIYVSWIRMDLC